MRSRCRRKSVATLPITQCRSPWMFQVTNFELFRMKAKAIAVDVVELTEEVIAFAWEPKGSRFAVIHGDNPQRYSVSFYTMGNPKNGQVHPLTHLLMSI